MICDYCNKPFSRSHSAVNKWRFHFCTKKCYMQYRREVWKPKKYIKKDTSYQKKLKYLANLRLENAAKS